MKKLLLLMLVIFSFSCSSDDSNTTQMPEKFDIRVEIKGVNTISEIHLVVNSISQKKWEYEELPFNDEYVYYTEDRDSKFITITSLAYISKIHEMTEYNLYVDGKIVDSTTITPNTNFDGTMKVSVLEFVYKP
ncbi:hypothetical protein [Myroides odoratus]|uniref:hypothetical protein n=1 Tax=Myroides odoratus TaxID=256 RepID=UPI0033428137